MKREHGDVTVGDVFDIPWDVDETLTGKTLILELYHETGKGKKLTSPAISGTTATFTTTSSTIDTAGVWVHYMYDSTSGKYYIKESGNVFRARPKPAVMARS